MVFVATAGACRELACLVGVDGGSGLENGDVDVVLLHLRWFDGGGLIGGSDYAGPACGAQFFVLSCRAHTLTLYPHVAFLGLLRFWEVLVDVGCGD